MLIIDTREKRWDHIKNYLDKNNIPYDHTKLDFGDYQIEGEKIIVDRKHNLDEIAANLCTKDSWRFWRELSGANSRHLKMIVLIEHGPSIKTVDDVKNWKSSYSSITGRNLYNEMFRATVAYGVRWEFCTKAQTPKRILELLHYDVRRN